MTIAEWIEQNVTTDKRALDWYQSPESEPRIVRAYRELLSGYEADPSKILKTTCTVEGEYTGAVRIRDINYYSICAHHFLPFFGAVDIVYIPGDRILGLGKFPRLVQAFSRRFQIQEHLVKDIATEIVTSGGARAAQASASGRHMCMCSRGPSDQTVITDTSYTAGDVQLLQASETQALRRL
ncbi:MULTISPECIES: GTP cyclohydrolase I [Streptomyces]|uniref:GTP cyclohydrolase 1 n=1 Tax=Streptomyces nigrescens TaxID=1920 RepID=A0ABY7IVL8_STRNI|nr:MULTISPECIES: GTP cyclohydrolase I [Streptomyces]MCW7983927.1 GTP cyclohydrolase [Streptomyces platensis subsp. clarensis]WAU02888.1 GTP cyclohydrolase I [Streptomyces nigrescens]WDT59127.1 GTP cyclohydrolase I [Streptomyces sp. G7(2002)]